MDRDPGSGSTRSPWIEIFLFDPVTGEVSRAPHGARGLKYCNIQNNACSYIVGLHTEPVD